MAGRDREKDVCIPREEWKRRVRLANNSLYVHLVGIPYQVQIEPHPNELMVDHVWYDVEIPPCGRLRLTINTASRINQRAGFDPRMRMAVLESVYDQRPEPFMEEAPPLDYRELEAKGAVTYALYDHDPLEALLIAKGKKAMRVEAWGELYIRNHLGVHQLHSRRGSSAVPADFLGRDGAIKLYYADMTAEMLLFKFSGQA
jgi:hypothetical protein